MCGIVGLFLKRSNLEAEFGGMLETMLATMHDRGPDSAGFAVYGSETKGTVKITVRVTDDTDLDALAVPVERRATHALLHVPADRLDAVRNALAEHTPPVPIVGEGVSMELYKEVGEPGDVARRFGLGGMRGTHGVAHTRMATESAVTTDGAHPYSTGLDQCLVHNGSLSNHHLLRRRLERDGFAFRTDNDTEVAASYLTSRMRRGDNLAGALTASLDDLDGFFTFVVATRTGFAVLRDPIGCKPAVLAETEDWVGFGSEYRALAQLPGIERARVWEPAPSRVYAWEHAQ